jgi:hypothetical protein
MAMEQEKDVSVQKSEVTALEFLKHPDCDSKSEMQVYIQTRFAHLLDEDDLKLLSNGNRECLAFLSQKCREANSIENTKDRLKSTN